MLAVIIAVAVLLLRRLAGPWRGRLREHLKPCGAITNIPIMTRRRRRFRWTKAIYRQRNLIERFLNKLKQFRGIATHYDKLGVNFRVFVQIAIVRISIRSIESTT